MAGLDISSLTDEELARRCKRTAAEEWLHDSGCLIGLLTGLTACLTVVALGVRGVLPLAQVFHHLLGGAG